MVRKPRVVRFALSLAFFFASGSLIADERADPISTGYELSNVEETVGDYSYPHSCGCRGRDESRFVFNTRIGADYYRVPGESLFGGAYGFDLGFQLTDDWGLVASANANHVDQGTQFVGSLGAVKLPNLRGCNWRDPFSFSFFFDQYTDSRINTVKHSLYLSGIRLQAGYALSETLETGVIYTTPTEDDDDVNFLFVSFPNSLPTPGIVEMSESVSGYAAGRVDDLQWAATAGYRDSPGTFTLGGNLRRSITDSVALFANSSYEANNANWGVGFGIEISLGPSGRAAHWREASRPFAPLGCGGPSWGDI